MGRVPLRQVVPQPRHGGALRRIPALPPLFLHTGLTLETGSVCFGLLHTGLTLETGSVCFGLLRAS